MFYNGIDEYNWPDIGGLAIILKDANCNCFYEIYAYSCEHKFKTPDDMIEAAQFIDENFHGKWLIGRDISGFELEIDAMAFKLGWL